MKELLGELRPQQGEEDLRGFEWHYWDRLCHSEQRKVNLEGGWWGSSIQAVISGDGTRLARTHVESLAEDQEDRLMRLVGGQEVVRKNISKGTLIVQVADLNTGKAVFTRKFEVTGGEANAYPRLSINHDGSRLVMVRGSSPFRQRLIVWDIVNDKEIVAEDVRFHVQVALSPDGKRMAAFESIPNFPERKSDRRIQIRDLSDPKRPSINIEVSEIPRRNTLVFSPDGSRIAISSDTREEVKGTTRTTLTGAVIQVWDTATGKSLGRCESSDFSLVELGFSPDSTRLIGAGRSLGKDDLDTGTGWRSQSFLWQIKDGELKRLRTTAINGTFPSEIAQLVVSPDGKRVAIGCQSARSIHVLDVASGEERQVIKTSASMRTWGFRQTDSRLVAVAAEGGAAVLREWDTVRDEPAAPKAARRKTPRSNEPIARTVTSRDNQRKAVFTMETYFDYKLSPKKPGVPSPVSVRDGEDKEIRVFRGHRAGIIYLTFSPSGRLVYSSDISGRILIWDCESGEVRWEHEGIPTGALTALREKVKIFNVPVNTRPIRPDHLLVLPDAKDFKVVNFDDLSERFTIGVPSSFDFSHDGRRFLAIYLPPPKSKETGTMKLWDVETGKLIATEPIAPDDVQFSADNRLLITFHQNPSSGESVVLRDGETGQRRGVLRCSPQLYPTGNWQTQRLVLSPDGSRAFFDQSRARGGKSGEEAKVFDLITGEPLFRMEGVGRPSASHVCFSPDNKRIATARPEGRDTRFTIWDGTTGSQLLTWKEAGAVPEWRKLLFSADGHRLILQGFVRPRESGEEGQPDKVWDATPRAETR